MRRRRILAALAGLAALVAVGALWFVFAPTGLGGRVDYAVIYGTSMEPTLHRGDLVVLHRRRSYSVGEVVGYRNRDLRRVVLHRIIGRHGGHFVFKGDNNGFVDSFEAAPNQVVGRLWLRVPAVGNALVWLRTPRGAVIAGTLAAVLLAGGGLGAGAGARRRRRDPGTSRSVQKPRRASAAAHSAAGPLVAAGAAGVVAFGLVAVLGAVHAHTRLVSDGNAYRQTASFGYGGEAPAGSVYPAGVVRTGDTVFTKLVHRLRLTVDYRFRSSLPHAITGRGAFVATLTSQQGLRRVLPLAHTASLTGGRWRASGSLDLDELGSAIDEYQRSTGVLSDSYTLDVSARVALRGVVGGQRVDSTFAPTPVSFSLDATKLQLLVPEQAGPAAPAADPLHVVAAGSIVSAAPARIVLGPLRLSVATARKVGIEGALAAFVLLALGLVLLDRGRGGDTLARILRRYDAWLIDVSSPLSAPQVVDLTAIESLGRLAEHYDRAILHHEERGVHTFAIEREGTLYRYRLGGEVRRLEPLASEAPTAIVKREWR